MAVASGLFPLFEAEHGVISAVTKIRRRVPVEDYLRPQNRFAHLFKGNGDPERIAAIQRIADANIAGFGLVDEEEADK